MRPPPRRRPLQPPPGSRPAWAAALPCAPDAEQEYYRCSLARLLAFWRWSNLPPDPPGRELGLGLRVWRVQCVLRPDGPGGVLCARCGLMSMSAVALDRRPCELLALPRDVRSALRSGAYAAVVATAPGCVRVVLHEVVQGAPIGSASPPLGSAKTIGSAGPPLGPAVLRYSAPGRGAQGASLFRRSACAREHNSANSWLWVRPPCRLQPACH